MERIAPAMLALFDAPGAGAGVGFALLDGDLRYLAISSWLARAHGRPAGEIVGHTVGEVIPEVAGDVEPILRDVLETGHPRLGAEVGPSGPYRRVWLGNYYPLRDGGAAALAAVVVDITDRKRAEEALRESSERLNLAQRLAGMGAWTWHVDERRAEWSEHLFDLYGVPDTLQLEPWLERVVAEDRPAFDAAMRQALDRGEPFDVQFRFRRPDGRIMHLRTAGAALRDAAGRVTTLKGFAQDVTGLRRALEQQRAVAELGQAAISGADLDTLLADAVAAVADVMLVEQALVTERLPDGRFLLRAGRGWPEGTVGEAVVPATGQSGYTLETGGPVLVADWRTERRFEMSPPLRDVPARSGASVPIACQDGAFGVLSVESSHPDHFGADDVTFLQAVANVLAGAIDARRSADRIAELAEARRRLVAQALDAEERTRRGIAESLHDGALQEALLLRHSIGRLLGGGQQDADRVRGAIERMAAQLREAMVALHPTVLQAGGLASALKAVADQQARLGGFRAEVEVDPAAAGVRDELVLSIARELLVNAAKHARAERVRVEVRRAGDAVELEVADDGTGIPEERLRAAVAEGHIGLASSAERVAAVGGRFLIDGAPGRGTVAKARLPA